MTLNSNATTGSRIPKSASKNLKFNWILLAIATFGFISGANASLFKKPKWNSRLGFHSKELKMKISWTDSPLNHILNNENDLLEVCYLMHDCFDNDSEEGNNEENTVDPYQECINMVGNTLRTKDTGFMYEGKRLVGLVSIKYNETPSRVEMRVFDVCVDSKDRGKGLATRMVPQLIKAVKEKRVIDPSKKVYAGLGVDFSNNSSAKAFSVYAKLGFTRWWQPCEGTYEIDFEVLERQENDEIPSLPMADYILRREETMEKVFAPNENGKIPYFCMVMKVDSDEFSTIGTDLMNYVQAATYKDEENIPNKK